MDGVKSYLVSRSASPSAWIVVVILVIAQVPYQAVHFVPFRSFRRVLDGHIICNPNLQLLNLRRTSAFGIISTLLLPLFPVPIAKPTLGLTMSGISRYQFAVSVCGVHLLLQGCDNKMMTLSMRLQKNPNVLFTLMV